MWKNEVNEKEEGATKEKLKKSSPELIGSPKSNAW